MIPPRDWLTITTDPRRTAMRPLHVDSPPPVMSPAREKFTERNPYSLCAPRGYEDTSGGRGPESPQGHHRPGLKPGPKGARERPSTETADNWLGGEPPVGMHRRFRPLTEAMRWTPGEPEGPRPCRSKYSVCQSGISGLRIEPLNGTELRLKEVRSSRGFYRAISTAIVATCGLVAL